MRLIKRILLAISFVLLAFGPAYAGFSFSIGTDDFYLAVGDYDYLPYAFVDTPAYVPPRISFYDALSDYGYWVYVNPFNQVWVPYASYGWRPYTYGHWIWTSHGWYWQGYEPWAWIGYHYGHWIWTSRFGWAWVPDYNWHPGRVVWAQGYDTVGWMPAPPPGYDYSRGYIAYAGPTNQFTYFDADFGHFEAGYYSYGGPYYDPRFRDLYYNPSYQSIGFNLWIFVNNTHFGYDNYADYYLDVDYTRHIFERRLVRISSRPVERTVMERVVKQRIVEVPVTEKELQTDKQKVKVVVPVGQEAENMRKNANRVVKEVIAPAFVEKQKTFKGEKAKNTDAVARVFRQENVQPKVQTVTSDVVIKQAEEAKKKRETRRVEIIQKEKEEVVKIEKEGKVRPAKTERPEVEKEKEKGKEKEKEVEKSQPRTTPPKQSGTRDTQIERSTPPQPSKSRDEQFETEKKSKKETEEVRGAKESERGASKKEVEEPKKSVAPGRPPAGEKEVKKSEESEEAASAKKTEETQTAASEEEENEETDQKSKGKSDSKKKEKSSTKKSKSNEKDKDKDKKNEDDQN